ncbi:MAG: hypothetical protein H0V45_03135 [Actinobacteria bacterium]|nr:hypothetical protein [Actinomycetota bacterium]
MIHVQQPPVPASLAGPNSAGERERAKVTAFYGITTNSAEPFDFAAYKGDDVKRTLTTSFHGKCAYCEGPFEGTAPVDVEHWRPKGGYVVVGGLRKPGYYWLAAEWANLLPSCIDCNRERTQDFPDEPAHLSGKSNKFPIVTESRRATAVGEESRERPLLLHPYFDDPDEHLEFLAEGLIRARKRGSRRSRKGAKSIEVYGLQRHGLVNRRATTLRRMEAWMGMIEKAARRLETGPSAGVAALLREDIAEGLDALEDYRETASEYSAMADHMIEQFKARLNL